MLSALAENDRDDAEAYLGDLLNWIERGGFLPVVQFAGPGKFGVERQLAGKSSE